MLSALITRGVRSDNFPLLSSSDGHALKVWHGLVLSKRTVHAVTNFGLHTDVRRGVCVNPCGPSRTRLDDEFYVTLTRADPCGHAVAKSMNWPLECSEAKSNYDMSVGCGCCPGASVILTLTSVWFSRYISLMKHF